MTATLTAIADTSRWPSETCEWRSIAACQRADSKGAALLALTISSPPIASTSTACLICPSCIALADSRSSAGWASAATMITNGTIASGTNTNGPPISAITANVIAMNGRSTTAVSVTEAKKSRSVSSSRIIAASDPVEPVRTSMRIASSRRKTFSPTSSSIRAPAISAK